MRRASIAELKARLSQFIDAVRAGEEVVVTDRGRPVARLTAIRSAEGLEARAAQMVRAGLARAPQGELPRNFWKLPRPADPEGRSLALILADRDEGW